MLFQCAISDNKKKLRLLSLSLSLLIVLFTGCKKEETADTTDYSPLFKNIVWTGELRYKNDLIQLYSVKFNEDGTCLWIEFAAVKKASWQLERNKIKIVFQDNSGQETYMEATVTRDKKLDNIRNTDPAGLSVLSARVNPSTEMTLAGSTWKNDYAEIKFEKTQDILYRGFHDPLHEWLSCSFARGQGFIVFSSQLVNRLGNFYGQIQPDGTLKVRFAKNNFQSFTKQ